MFICPELCDLEEEKAEKIIDVMESFQHGDNRAVHDFYKEKPPFDSTNWTSFEVFEDRYPVLGKRLGNLFPYL